MPEMRILTVRQPWAWAIIHGGKNVENRVRNIVGAYRGPVAIQAGLARFDDEGQFWEVRRAITAEWNGWPASDGDVWSADPVEPDDPRFTYGAIIGVVDLVDVHNSGSAAFDGEGTRFAPLCSPWAEQDAHHLVLANPRALAKPIPFRGALGLRVLDEQTQALVLAGIAKERE